MSVELPFRPYHLWESCSHASSHLQAVFVGSPPPLGYDLTLRQQAGSYFSPVLGCILGEFVGRYLNDYIARRGIRKNHGVFEPEMRLWTLYFALPFFIAGFLLLGYSFQYKLNFAACAIGWVMAEFAILVTVGFR